MKPNLISTCILALLYLATFFCSCSDIIEPSISKRVLKAEAPSEQYQSTNYTINFWWDEVDGALSYHLQVVTPNFNQPGALSLDTIVKKNTFSYALNPGAYQWRVLAENGSSQTSYTSPVDFTILSGSIRQQTVQLIAPVNNFLTNQPNIIFKWESLYDASKYQIEIDTNNFANENSLALNQIVAAQQVDFSFPKDQIYQWRVKALNDTAQSQWSSVNVVNYDHTPPQKTTLIAPDDGVISISPVLLQWNDVPGTSKYKLYIYGSDGVTIYNQSFPMYLTTNNYSFKLGNSGDKFYWMVTASDAAGNESLSSGLRSFILQ